MKNRTLLLAGILTFMFAGNNYSSGRSGEGKNTPSVRIGQPFRIYPSSITQTETFITRDPMNATILFASANTINPANGFISEGIYVSTNAGATWRGNDTCTGAPVTFHRGDPGIVIDKNGTFILVRLGFSPGLYSHSSTDLGRTWGPQKTIATNDQDRASLTSDVISTSSFYGRSYTAWVRFAPPYPVYFSYTDDGGANWTAPAQINSPSQRSQGAELSIGPGGRMNLCWAGVLNTSPFTEDFVGFATSTNGGATWAITENAYDANGIQGTFPQKGNIRVNGLPKIATDLSGGSRHGWIYIVTAEKNLAPAGSDPDIIFHRSTNNGATWSAGIRVNRDAMNNGKMQFFPAIHVDNGGGINVLYYDDRNTTSDSATVYLSRSIDGGNSWTDIRVGTNTFRPQAIGGLGQGYQGDNISMTSLGNTLWPVWMDNSTGLYQIWTSPIDIAALSVELNETFVPEKFELLQNYPNPFNPTTQVRFRIARSGFVNMRVVDLHGREVRTLVNEELKPGSYSATFNAEGLASGVYFYQLRSEGIQQTRKMLLVR